MVFIDDLDTDCGIHARVYLNDVPAGHAIESSIGQTIASKTIR
jgi:hypothetical protein